MNQQENKGVDVDAILNEMKQTRTGVAREVLQSDELPLFLDEGVEMSEVISQSLEELIEELEETEGIVFNI